jgi:hypothetical protein
MKPTLRSYKGDIKLLEQNYGEVLTILGGTTEHKVYEKRGTDKLHIHALISCPYIQHKEILSKYIMGYHYHLEIVRKNKNVEEVWLAYLGKERSEAEKFHFVYGNMFPLEDLA